MEGNVFESCRVDIGRSVGGRCISEAFHVSRFSSVSDVVSYLFIYPIYLLSLLFIPPSDLPHLEIQSPLSSFRTPHKDENHAAVTCISLIRTASV